jgi:hypothetical protein
MGTVLFISLQCLTEGLVLDKRAAIEVGMLFRWMNTLEGYKWFFGEISSRTNGTGCSLTDFPYTFVSSLRNTIF